MKRLDAAERAARSGVRAVGAFKSSRAERLLSDLTEILNNALNKFTPMERARRLRKVEAIVAACRERKRGH